MITVHTIESDNPTRDQLEMFKQYASVPSDDRDGLLLAMLRKAMLAIQSYANVALIKTKFRLVVDDVKAGEEFSLYGGAGQIISVTDNTGSSVAYTDLGGRIQIRQACANLRVVYVNAPEAAEMQRFEPVVWQYATALFDGADGKTLDSIINSVIC